MKGVKNKINPKYASTKKETKKETTQEEKQKEQSSKIKELKGFIISVSGFSNIECQTLKEKIEKLGGIYADNLLKKTDILIVNKICTNKALSAMENGKKVVTADFLDENNKEKFLESSLCKPEIFLGVEFFIYGFGDEELIIINNNILKHKGLIGNNADESDIILIKSDLILIDIEIEKLKKYQSKVTTEIWFNNCIQKNEFINLNKEKTSILNIDIVKAKYNNILQNINNYNYKNLFLGQVFGIMGFKDDTKIKLINLISFCNGIFYETILENTNYVIVPLTFNDFENIQKLKNIFNQSPNIVNINWLFDCITKGTIMDIKKYRPLKAFNTQLPKTNNKKIIFLGDIFKGKTFSIFTRTYNKKEIDDLKEKITQNMGEYFDAKNSENLKEIQARFIIINDGYPNTWDKTINDNRKYDLGKNIVSHRFIEECLSKKNIVENSEYFDLIPFPFKVPVKEFENFYFYLHYSQFSFLENYYYERLIETIGGHCDELNKNTTHVLFKIKKISKRSEDKLIKKSNKNIKCVNEEFLSDFILKCGKCNIDDYLIQIEDK